MKKKRNILKIWFSENKFSILKEVVCRNKYFVITIKICFYVKTIIFCFSIQLFNSKEYRIHVFLNKYFEVMSKK